MPPISRNWASLAALARQPTKAMKTGMRGAATSSTRAATQETAATTASRTRGTRVAFMRAGRKRDR